MVAIREKCPHCGTAHNPLLHSSFRTTPPLMGRFGKYDSVLPEPELHETVTFTYLCDNCGETYWIESEVDGHTTY